MMLGLRLLGRRAEQHDVADHLGPLRRCGCRRTPRPARESTEADSADTISGNRSVMPPGWMPVPCSVDAALLARLLDAGPGLARSRVPPADRRDDVLARARGCGRPSADRPSAARRRRSRRRARAPRRRRRSRRRRSGRGRRARRRPGRPSPRCGPSSPTSSRSGWPSTPSIAARPTPPVAHWMTRYVTHSPRWSPARWTPTARRPPVRPRRPAAWHPDPPPTTGTTARPSGG